MIAISIINISHDQRNAKSSSLSEDTYCYIEFLVAVNSGSHLTKMLNYTSNGETMITKYKKQDLYMSETVTFNPCLTYSCLKGDCPIKIDSVSSQCTNL